jgi:hypothetical protein
MGFEPTILASGRVKTVHALDRPATMTGKFKYNELNINKLYTSEKIKDLMTETMFFKGHVQETHSKF